MPFRAAIRPMSMLEDRQAERQHRDEALTTRQQLRAVAELGQEVHGFGSGLRGVVLEPGGLQRCG
jgi:hypothetical protein